MKRLLTIGHSYVVGQNRRLAHEMAIAGEGRWEVTAAAPVALEGDLRRIALEAIEGERSRLVPLQMSTQRFPHLRTFRGLATLMSESWDAVHCWEEPYVAAGWQVARHAPRDARVIVATFQNISKRYPPPFSWMERTVMRRADGWVAFGRTVEQALRARPGYADCPRQVIAPGVDVGRFRPDAEAGARVRASLGWDAAAPIIGFVGRLVPEKGIGMLIAALAALKMPWRALFVGSGPEEGAVQSFARRHPGAVRVASGVSHDDVPAYMAAMDVLCAPSQTTVTWQEQFGRMLIEAMACGLPVVGSNSGEIPFVLDEAGIVLPEGSAPAWTATLEALLDDAARRQRMASAGLARARTEFAWPVVARRHLEFVERVVAA